MTFASSSRSLIVGTAGHIDHGKSSLVRSLTGTDPDRLKQERERGITIDLGFAHCSLPSGRVASFIDVPGHEKFVRNMLAGAHGIDAVMLVVAADESVMPQTREHFEICRLLGVEKGLVALTKCDLADADLQAVAESEVQELVDSSFLDGAPVLRVSSRTGAGLDDLRAALDVLAGALRVRSREGLPRLPVDRVFTLKGFGTVVTGTLLSGELATGEELEILPSGLRARVRGLQVHGASLASVGSGNRAAVNLAGVEVSQLARGDVLVRAGSFAATSVVEAEVVLLATAKPVSDRARVRVHSGSTEALARVRLVGELAPGHTAVAQLRFETPVVVVRGDRLVLRSYSPAETIGGARVLDPRPLKRKLGLAPAVDLDPGRAGAGFVEAAGRAGVRLSDLVARLGLPPAWVREALAAHPSAVRIGEGESEGWISASALEALGAEALRALKRFHQEQPLEPAMPREGWRARVFSRAAPGAFETVAAQLAKGAIRLEADAVTLAGHSVTLNDTETKARESLLQKLALAGVAGFAAADAAREAGLDPKLAERVTRVLLQQGQIAKVGDQLVERAALEELKSQLRARFEKGARLEVADLKTLTGLTRKYVIPLLEWLDREKLTRRSGADRFVAG